MAISKPVWTNGPGAARRLALYERFNFACAECGWSPSVIPKNYDGRRALSKWFGPPSDRSFLVLEIDHIQPLRLGGTNNPSNLQVLCTTCNLRKGSHDTEREEMTWARLDDRFYSHRKVRRAWKLCRASIGLHTLALTYTCGYDLNGRVDSEFVEMMLPAQRERERAVAALVQAGLWEENGDDWLIHDFLDYNQSADEIREKRDREAARKAAARAKAANGSPA